MIFVYKQNQLLKRENERLAKYEKYKINWMFFNMTIGYSLF